MRNERCSVLCVGLVRLIAEETVVGGQPAAELTREFWRSQEFVAPWHSQRIRGRTFDSGFSSSFVVLSNNRDAQGS